MLVERLLARGDRVRVLVTDQAKRSALSPEVEVVVGDLDDPDGVRRASAGVDAAVLQLPVAVRNPEAAIGAVDAARMNGARVVYVTNGPVACGTGVGTIDLAHAVDEHVRGGDPPGITLRTTLYLGNLAAPWSAPELVRDGVLPYPLPADARVAWISAEDAAAYVVGALERPDLAGRSLQMAGPESLAGEALAAGLETGLGRPVRYQDVDPAAFQPSLVPFLGEQAARSVGDLYRFLRTDGAPHLDVAPAPELREHVKRGTTVAAWAVEQPWRALAAGTPAGPDAS